MIQYELFDYSEGQETELAFEYIFDDELVVVVCPYCLGITQHIFGETSTCFNCNNIFCDSDLEASGMEN